MVVAKGLHPAFLQEAHADCFLGILWQRRCVTVSISIMGGRACGQMFSASVVGVWFVLVVRVQIDLFDSPSQ